MKKTLLLAMTILSSGIVNVNAQPPTPMGPAMPPPGSVAGSPMPPSSPPPGVTPGTPLPPGTPPSTPQPPNTSVGTQPQLPSIPPPPPNVVNQGFNLFKPGQPQNKPPQPANTPNGLPSLQSLIGNQSPMSLSSNSVILYGTMCNGIYCKAITNYGILTKGQCITNHMCVKSINSNSLTIETKFKLGKKEKGEIQTIGLFTGMENGR